MPADERAIADARQQREPWLDSLRGSSEFKSIVQVAETGYRDAAAAFAAAGGETLLGPADAPQ